MILKQNLDVLVPKYIGTISFVFHFLEQIQRADWGAIVFGSRVDVTSNRRPRLPETRSCNTSGATLKGRRKSRIQENSKFFSPKMLQITSGFVLAKKKIGGLGALLYSWVGDSLDFWWVCASGSLTFDPVTDYREGLFPRSSPAPIWDLTSEHDLFSDVPLLLENQVLN